MISMLWGAKKSQKGFSLIKIFQLRRLNKKSIDFLLLGFADFIMDLLSTANTKFCLDFFKALKTENTDKNIFFSPLSISAVLGMVLLGARGNTAKQIKEVGFLHFIGIGLVGVIICYFAYNIQNSKNILTRQKLLSYNDQIYKIHILFFLLWSFLSICCFLLKRYI